LLKLLFNLIFIFTNILLAASYSHALSNKGSFRLQRGAAGRQPQASSSGRKIKYTPEGIFAAF